MKKFKLLGTLLGAFLLGTSLLLAGIQGDIFSTGDPNTNEVRMDSSGSIIQKAGSNADNVLSSTTVNGSLDITGDFNITTAELAVFQETFIDAIAVDSNTYLSQLDISTSAIGAAGTTSYVLADILVQPTYPRTVSFVMTDSAANSTGTITIGGTTANGDIVTDTYSFGGANMGVTRVTDHAFIYLSTVSIAYSGYGSDDDELFWVGVSSHVGVANDPSSAANLVNAIENGARVTSGTWDFTYDKYLPATAPNGTIDYTLYYKSTATP